jgi:hypothetical protein
VKKTADLIAQLRQRFVVGQRRGLLHAGPLYRIEIYTSLIIYRNAIYINPATGRTADGHPGVSRQCRTGHRGYPAFRILGPLILLGTNDEEVTQP